MWHDHPFESKIQCNKDSREMGGWLKFEKKAGWQYRGDLCKIGGLGTLCLKGDIFANILKFCRFWCEMLTQQNISNFKIV